MPTSTCSVSVSLVRLTTCCRKSHGSVPREPLVKLVRAIVDPAVVAVAGNVVLGRELLHLGAPRRLSTGGRKPLGRLLLLNCRTGYGPVFGLWAGFSGGGERVMSLRRARGSGYAAVAWRPASAAALVRFRCANAQAPGCWRSARASV
jgi:hypothetical protein